MSKLLGGEFGLAVTYWLLFFLGASSFFIFGSQAVDQERWLLYGHRRQHWLHFADSGNQGGLQRATALESYVAHLSIFMIINVLVGISTLGFIY